MAVQRISPAETQALLGDGYTYVDVRSVPEYDGGHPEGAVNVPLLNMGPGGMSPNPDFLGALGARFPKDAKLVIGCKVGGRSQKAAMMLEQAGFTALKEMRGGWSGEVDGFGRIVEKGWSTLGLPSSTTPTPGGSWDEIRGRKP